jgi:uncharacterized coiled-coil protein SlyX
VEQEKLDLKAALAQLGGFARTMRAVIAVDEACQKIGSLDGAIKEQGDVLRELEEKSVFAAKRLEAVSGEVDAASAQLQAFKAAAEKLRAQALLEAQSIVDEAVSKASVSIKDADLAVTAMRAARQEAEDGLNEINHTLAEKRSELAALDQKIRKVKEAALEALR